MLNYIYELCKEHKCTCDLIIGPDGAMSVKVHGKCTDFLIIRADWDEDIIKDCIKDTIRRACND